MSSIRSPIFRWGYLILLLFSLSSCGGGGGGGGSGGGSGDVFSISTNTLSFVAETQSVMVSPQFISGTINADLTGTLYIVARVEGNAVSRTPNFSINEKSRKGTAEISAANPSTLGVGTYNSTITVRACLNDSTCATGELSGSPKTVRVTYEIKSSVKADTLMPSIAIANQPGEVILRGNGFASANVNQVFFNGVSATSFTLVNDTQIQATYPALAEGTYAVELRNPAGILPFSGNLTVVASKTHLAGTLSYPSTQQTLALVYDAKREALLVAASYFDGSNRDTTSRMRNKILRYQFSNGVFMTLNSLEVPLLRDLALSPDGDTLLAITDSQIIHLNPSTLEQVSATKNTMLIGGGGHYLKNIVITNDGNAIITTGYNGSGNTRTYLYPLSQAMFYPTIHSCTYNGSAGAGANGSLAAIIQGSLSPTPPTCRYESTQGRFTANSVSANQRSCDGSTMGKCINPVVSKSGDRIAIIDESFTLRVYDNSFNLLGQLPGTHGAASFSPNGDKIYSYDSTGVLRTFLLGQEVVNGFFVESGSGTALAGNPGVGVEPFSSSPTTIVRMIASPDGKTVFIAGSNLIAIAPAP